MRNTLVLAISILLAQAASANPAEKRVELDAVLTERAEIIDREMQRKLAEVIDSASIESAGQVPEPTLPHVAQISDSRQPLRLAGNYTH